VATPIEQEEVDEEFFAVDFEAVLVAEEGETFAEGHDHVFYVGDELAFNDSERPESGGCFIDIEESFFIGFTLGDQ